MFVSSIGKLNRRAPADRRGDFELRARRKLRAFRLATGLSQVRFAQEVGVSTSCIEEAERGASSPRAWLLEAAEEVAKRGQS